MLDLRAIAIDSDNMERIGKVGNIFDERNLPSEIYKRKKFFKAHRVKRAEEYTEEERRDRAEALLSGRKTAEQLVEYVAIEEEIKNNHF